MNRRSINSVSSCTFSVGVGVHVCKLVLVISVVSDNANIQHVIASKRRSVLFLSLLMVFENRKPCKNVIWWIDEIKNLVKNIKKKSVKVLNQN